MVGLVTDDFRDGVVMVVLAQSLGCAREGPYYDFSQ